MDVTPVLEVIDQRSVQKRGGDFARYPSSYVVCSLLRRYGLRRVLDVTYGEGRFYYLCKSDVEVVAADPVKWQWVVKPNQFLQLNVFQLYMMLSDAIVTDPPWGVGFDEYDDFKVFLDVRDELYRVLKNDSWLVFYKVKFKNP
jgi:hypothetical protein